MAGDVERHAEALKIREETLERRKTTLGSEHPAKLRNMVGLIGSYNGVGRYAEALKLGKETLSLLRNGLGITSRFHNLLGIAR